MRAMTISSPGGPEVLSWSEVPEPSPAPGELLVEVDAAGVNRADVLQRRGLYPPPAGAPEWPGLEISGRVVDVGSGVTGWQQGDALCALLYGGGYAERAVVSVSLALPVPDGVSLRNSAALPEATATAWSNLVGAGGLRPGQTVLVHGGSGGVGSVAVQLAAALGARVIATARDAERCGRVRELGADVAISYADTDVTAAVLDATEGRGADVVLDILGAGALAANLACLATDGRLVVIGLQQGRRTELDLGELLTRRLTIAGTTLRSRPLAHQAAILAELREHVWPLIASGLVRPVVHAELPMDDAGLAHELLDSGEVFGKLLLVPPRSG